MARPRLGKGTWGNITTTKQPDGRIKARCKFRDNYGKLRSAEALGNSKTAATTALTDRVKRRLGQRNGKFNSESLLSVAGTKWWATIEERAALNSEHPKYLNPDTRIEYQRYYNKVIDAFGDLQLFECETDVLEEGIREHAGGKPRVANEMKRTLVGIFDNAMRLSAIKYNYAKSVSTAPVATKQARALTDAEYATVRQRIHDYETGGGAAAPRATGKGRGGRPRAQYLLDLFDLQLALMCRIGEVLALQWDTDVHGLDGDGDVTVVMNSTLKHRTKAEAERTGLPAGLYRQEHPKTVAGNRAITFKPDEHAVAVLRKLQASRTEGVPWLFATSVGTPRSPSNARTALRKARGEEFEWFTPHSLRRTGITNALVSGANLMAVSRAAGHGRVTTTEGYTDKTHFAEDLSQARRRYSPEAA